MYGGKGHARYVAYVGSAGKLRQRIEQHLDRRDSSIVTSASAVRNHPDQLLGVSWWENEEFATKAKLAAAELVAFEVLDPVVRSRGKPMKEAKAYLADPAFKERMRGVFEGEPTGWLHIPDWNHVVVMLRTLE